MKNTETTGNPLLLPLDGWRTGMSGAVEAICTLGLEVLKVHRLAGKEAAEQADRWGLEGRQRGEREALLKLFDATEHILAKLVCVMKQMSPPAMKAATEAIEEKLPCIEESFLVIRHAALDLLRWTRRSGRIEGSALPDEYRESHARLTAHAPQFKPSLDTLQRKLMERSRDPAADKSNSALFSAITRFNGVMDLARGFVRAIVEPPLELVFRETEGFLRDWDQYPVEERGRLASEINDCCQFLLYDEAEFDRRTEPVRPQLSDGLEASLFSLSAGAIHVLFTVDEDPVFGQLNITLLRAVQTDCRDETCDAIVQALYHDLIGGGSHG